MPLDIIIFLNFNCFFFFFLAVLGLCCCKQAFSSCSKLELRFFEVHGFLTVVPSLVEHRL